VTPRRARPRKNCPSAGACNARRSWCSGWARGEPGGRVAGEPGAGPRARQWHRVFVEQGKRGLRTKAEPEDRELTLARAKIGERMMRLELAEDLIEKRGFTDEWKRRRG